MPDAVNNVDLPVLREWTSAQQKNFGRDICLAPHDMASTGLFEDQALADLIDQYPRSRLQCFTMGNDIERFDELRPVDTAGVKGRDILEAVKIGRLWFKLQRIDQWDGYRQMMAKAYGELTERCPWFRPLEYRAVMLLSSPNAVVYFHADANPNMLYHIRGKKNVWLYPDGHKTLINQATMEDIYENHQDEEVPYSLDWEKHAKLVELNAGYVLAWPQNTPHRVTAVGDFNVSISTFYLTAESLRRSYIYGANRILRERFNLQRRSLDESGLSANLKIFGYRFARKMGRVQGGKAREYLADYRIDLTASCGISKIPGGPVRTEFR